MWFVDCIVLRGVALCVSKCKLAELGESMLVEPGIVPATLTDIPGAMLFT